MNLEPIAAGSQRGVLMPSTVHKQLQRLLLTLAAVSAAMFIAHTLQTGGDAEKETALWAIAFKLLAAAATLGWLLPRIPLQNIVIIVAITVGGSSLASLALPSVAVEATPGSNVHFGVALFLLVLNSRGLAEFILLPWRNFPGYGWRVMALGAVTIIGILPAWTNGKPHLIPSPQGFAATLAPFLQFLVAPWFIDKRRLTFPLNFTPVLLWFCLASVQLIPGLFGRTAIIHWTLLALNALLVIIASRHGRRQTLRTPAPTTIAPSTAPPV